MYVGHILLCLCTVMQRLSLCFVGVVLGYEGKYAPLTIMGRNTVKIGLYLVPHHQFWAHWSQPRLYYVHSHTQHEPLLKPALIAQSHNYKSNPQKKGGEAS